MIFLKKIYCESQILSLFENSALSTYSQTTISVKLGDEERFDKEQIGVKEPFPVTKCQFTP